MGLENYIRSKLRRHGTTFFVCGILFCFIIFTILNVCNPNIEIEKMKLAARRLEMMRNRSEVHTETIQYDLKTFLLVAVMSQPLNFESRKVIRETWARSRSESTKVCFVIGTKGIANRTRQELQDEQWLHQDLILLEDFEESYVKLTKKLLLTLVWIDKHIDFKYLLKVDEDSFVRLKNIVQELQNKPRERLYWGFFNGKARVHKSGKWPEMEFNLCDHYLPYALGGGYVISCDLVEFIAKNANILKLFLSEDVSLGVWLSPLDIRKMHDPQFDTEYKSRGCFNTYLVTHKKSLKEMRALQENVDNSNKLCVEEYRLRLSYEYNWNVLPTNCCNRTNRSIP